MKEPGRELDAEIAEKVMGLVPCDAWRWQYIPGAVAQLSVGGPPFYSTDIAAAWLVVEKIRVTHDFSLRISVAPNPAQAYWTADFWDGQHNHAASIKDGTTAPHAICLAALAAIGEQGA